MECQTKNNPLHAANSQKCDCDIQALEKILLDISTVTKETQRLAKQTMLNSERINDHDNEASLAIKESVKQLLDKSAVIWHECKEAVNKIYLDIQTYSTLVEPMEPKKNEARNLFLQHGVTTTIIYEMLQQAHREIEEIFLAVQNITTKTNFLLKIIEISQLAAKHTSKKRELIGAEGLSLNDYIK
ncbi:MULTISPECIES: hypothetical protein [Brevibacillus]|uniref:hypothetical protein n=1 Tax=Brevibacillus TaxID=55080 RepID=UPI0002404DAB|nr:MULTISPECIES: hypothetical protein [Brevibacillus]AYK05546.1 hypothetical protein D8Z77_03500 [Brevibacillus laterosporus]MBA4532449.1 hypothetical protein [Brevibacillus halotolerans]PCN42728.1 hypothetical protein B9C88_19000 [Brevibacillus laterosporus]CCF13544.1 hypothetical protein BLGI_1460 [Brevibacillus laterosporus GI-9]